MKTSVSTLGSRAAAVAWIAAVGLLGLVPPAAAEEANYGNIKESATGSITIHKHIQNDGTRGTADGQNAVEGGQPVQGVQFTAYPISDIDLTTVEGWSAVTALSADGAIPASACANPSTPTLAGHTINAGSGTASGDTDSQGQATIGGLTVKAYLVCETKTPSDILQKAKPFVVTVPHPNTAPGEEGDWLYDVNVYPKNERIAISKTIDDQRNNGYATGALVKFPVTSTLPALDAGSYYKYFQFKDVMDSRLTDLAVPEVSLGGTALTATTDYEVVVTGQTVTVTFTGAGLTKLKAGAGQEVKAVFQGKVASVGNGVIPNTAQLIADTVYADQPPNPQTPPQTPPGTPLTSPEVRTNWGDLKITKVDAHSLDGGNAGNDGDLEDDPSAPLERLVMPFLMNPRAQAGGKSALKGAEFQIYNAATPYAASCAGATRTGDPLSVSGQTTLTTDDRGVISIDALFVSDSVTDANRDNQPGATQRCYVLVETKAPAGYVLPAQAETPVTVKVGNTTEDNITIENTKQTVPNLPLTGSLGKILLSAAGVALLLIAAGAVAVSHRRGRRASSL
ncbi:SpaH/EbpB family LPXTG-anchored major pilin [Actinomyces gaoshouyii]|uniref:SpaH/EbpB family LPXTG-anchored major pilin n=1 Tax=Actinomyces gaoshouyii TaxID=1960083 RepID=UPI0009BCD128|nr:SpaH/EbpB family LPXTG-anchored major pilin [Actinomyces gaoshouyii]ARD42167.1 fimbrial protein [Actinomyces gaoshouyii]